MGIELGTTGTGSPSVPWALLFVCTKPQTTDVCMPLGTPNQDVGLFQPGSLIPKASPVRSEGEEEQFSPEVVI